MWQQSTSQQNPGCSKIPISLLKNFDPYEILEPQKVSHREQKLIDIESDAPINSVSEATDINVMLPKTNPDLVDLFENIYVTPQHIEKKKEMDMKINEQMYQNLRQITEWSKNDRSTKVVDVCRNCLSNVNRFEANDAPKVLTPPILQLKATPKTNDENLIDKTDVFNAFVLQRNENENSKLQNITQSFSLDSQSQQSNLNDDFEDHEELLDEILQAKCYEQNLREYNETRTLNTPSPQIPKINSHVVNSKPSQNNHNIDLPKKMDISDDRRTDKNVKLLDTVKKDEKLYVKKRIVKSDATKRAYTKGPDLQEKSIVLPQLMERLKERDKVLEGRKVVKRRLVLDTGSSTNKLVATKTKSNDTPSSLNPVVLMEDFNRERLIGFKTRKAFENFVRTGHY